MNKTLLLISFTLTIGCSKDDRHNTLQDKLTGTYEGNLNYSEKPIGDDAMVEPVTFTIYREGESKIKFSTSFDLSLEVSNTRKADGQQYITLSEGTTTKISSNGVEVVCGGSTWGDLGEMCGYYNITTNDLKISFAWSDGVNSSSGYLFAKKK